MRTLIPLTIMIILQFLIYSSQASIDGIAKSENIASPVFSTQNALMKVIGSDNQTVSSASFKNILPISDTGVLSTIGAYLFPFTVLLNWVTSAGTFILAFLMTIPNFLVTIGLPKALSYSLGFVWYAIATMFLILGVIK
jgi:hypothetical protein